MCGFRWADGDTAGHAWLEWDPECGHIDPNSTAIPKWAQAVAVFAPPLHALVAARSVHWRITVDLLRPHPRV